ncbi:rhomboid family intramembrane serine protease [Vibrio ostreicida]|nr:rhomboid family intramembrane serine protease [Vibrio ostreicida]
MPTLGLSIPKPIITFMLAWLVIGFVQPFMPIGNAAHLIGLLAGIAMGLLDVCRRTS